MSIDPRSMYRTFRSVVRFRSIELDPVERRLSSCADIEDLRRIARRRLLEVFSITSMVRLKMSGLLSGILRRLGVLAFALMCFVM